MGNWAPTEKVDSIEFDGDKIDFVLSRLEVEDMISLSQYMKEDGGKQKLSFSDSMEMCKVAGQLLPKYVKSVKGMTLSDGIEITIEKFCEVVPTQFYFMALVGELLGKLVEISTVSEGQEGNSDAPLAGNLTALSGEQMDLYVAQK